MRTVLIVDDHPGFRASARRLLASEGYEVLGEAGDLASGLHAARTLKPGLVLLDVQLPDGSGLSMAEELRALPEPPLVVLVSSHTGADFGPLVAESGAQGFLAKGELSAAALEELLA